VHRAVCLFTSQLSLVSITLGDWIGLHTEMVYSSTGGHPSKYKPDPAFTNFIDATNDVTKPNRLAIGTAAQQSSLCSV